MTSWPRLLLALVMLLPPLLAGPLRAVPAPAGAPGTAGSEGATESASVEDASEDAAKPGKKARKQKPTTTKKKKKTKKTTTGSAPAAPANTTTPSAFALAGSVGGAARLGVGVITGEGVHRTLDGGPVPMAVVAAAIDPQLSLGIVTLALPSRLEHRETWQGHLTRTDASSSLQLELKPMRQLRATVEAGLTARALPARLDPYQPVDDVADAGLLATDRRGGTSVQLGARLLAVPWSKTYVRLKYDFARSRSVVDPAFDAIERANHLTPTDRDQHELAASFKTTLGSLKPSLAVAVFRRESFFVFARDAGTGATHAGAGGAPPNPLQIVHGVEVEPGAVLRLLDGAVELDLAWRLRFVDDVFAGYYSRVENRFTMGVDAEVGPEDLALATRFRLDTTLVSFGDNAYATTKRHPPLDDGDRRELRRAGVSVQARFPARAAVRVFVDVAAQAQRTNFPDYVPGVFPAAQAYRVDWDRQVASALLGVELELDPDPG